MKLVLSAQVLRNCPRNDVAEKIVSWYNINHGTNYVLSSMTETLNICYRFMTDPALHRVYKDRYDNSYKWDWEYLAFNTDDKSICIMQALRSLLMTFLEEAGVERANVTDTLTYLMKYVSNITGLYKNVDNKFNNVASTSLADYTAMSGYVQKVQNSKFIVK